MIWHLISHPLPPQNNTANKHSKILDIEHMYFYTLSTYMNCQSDIERFSAEITSRLRHK